MAKESGNLLAKVGSWAFIIGVIIAIIVGIFTQGVGNPITTTFLILLGLVVGFLNVTGRETTPFLLAGISLVIVTNFGGPILGAAGGVGSSFGLALQGIMVAIMIFVIPAVIIVALKAIWALAHNE